MRDGDRVDKDVVEISIVIPVYNVEHQHVSLDFAAVVDWWGEPLETHFIYNFMIISDSMLSFIKINIHDIQTVRNMLNSQYEYVAEVKDYIFWYEDEDITEAWLAGNNALVGVYF